MTKHRKLPRKSIVAAIQQPAKVEIKNTGWRSMTNWLVVLAVVLPMLYSTQTIDPNITPRYIFLSAFVLIFVFFFSLTKRIRFYALYPFLIKAVFILSIAYCVWSIISMSFAINVAEALYEVVRFMLNTILLFLIMITVGQEATQVLKLFKAFVAVSFVQSVIGILQFYNLAFTSIPGMSVPYGLMGNRNLFGSAQVLLVPFVLFVLFKGNMLWKFLSLTSLIGLIISVVISQTRSAWLSVLAFGLTAFILIIIFSIVNRRKLFFVVLKSAVAIGLIVMTVFTVNKDTSFSKSIKGRALSLIGNRSGDNNSISGRIAEWKESFKIIKKHPLLGVGPANWKLEIMTVSSEVSPFAVGLTVPSWPHNVYVQQASETGVPGAIFFFNAWALTVVAGLKVLQKATSKEVSLIIILMLAGLAAFATDSMFSFPTERIEHALYLTVMMGTILGIYLKEKLQSTIEFGDVNKALLAFVILIGSFNLFLGYKKHNFERYAKLAINERTEGYYLDVIREVEAGKSKFVTLDPKGEPLEMHSAVAYYNLKDYKKAIKEITVAKKYNPNSARIYTINAVIYAAMKEYDSAIYCYNSALKLAPRYGVAIKNLAAIYFAAGDYAKCVEVLKKSYSNNVDLSYFLKEAQKKLQEQNK
jgi:putative inorganic carbon (hco3(-)) transporter